MRNLLLFFTLVGLITFVYFFEEKKTVNEIAQKVKREELFNTKELGDLKELSSSVLRITFDKQKIISENGIEVSSKKVDEFLQNLQKINVQRIFTDEEVASIGEFKTHAQFNLKFSSGDISLELGDPLSFDTSFYLRVITKNSMKIVIARYTGELLANIAIDPSSVNDKNKNLAPWFELKRLFSLTSRYFLVDNPFEQLDISNIIIKTFRTPVYELDFINKTTNPKILDGLSYRENSFTSYLLNIKSMKALNVEKMSLAPQMEVATVQISNDELIIYKKYLGKNSYFIKQNDVIFEIKGDDFRNLISPLQNFWNKKLSLSAEGAIFVEDKIGNKITLNNIWSNLLKEEAYSVSERSFNPEKADYIIRQNQSVFYVAKSQDGSEVYDTKTKLLYLFLTKLE